MEVWDDELKCGIGWGVRVRVKAKARASRGDEGGGGVCGGCMVDVCEFRK